MQTSLRRLAVRFFLAVITVLALIFIVGLGHESGCGGLSLSISQILAKAVIFVPNV